MKWVTTRGRRDSDIWKYGGGALWTTPSVDAELGLVYLETGNAVPQWGGELRPGNNLFDNSVVALELKTGKIRWYQQLIHHDIWEHDVSTPLVMYDAMVGGQMRKVIVAMRTDGVSFFLDRETGKPILPIEERPVKQDAFLKTSPTQPFTRGGDRVGPGCVDKNAIPPGFVAGCYFDPVRADVPNQYMPHMNMRQSPMAYSPQTGYLYATACVNPGWIRRDETGWAFIRPAKAPGQQQYGLMTAIDTRNGKVAWEKRLAYAACEGGGGATATAGGLVFHVEPDGVFQAWDAKNGAVLWQFQTGEAGIAGRRRPRRRLGRGVRKRRSAIRRPHHEPRGVGVQARRHASGTARAGGAADVDRVGRSGGGDVGDRARHRVELQHRQREQEGDVGRRLRPQPNPRADESRHGRDVQEFIDKAAHHRCAGRVLVDRRHSAGSVGQRDRHEAGHLRIHLYDAPMVDWPAHRGIAPSVLWRPEFSHEDTKTRIEIYIWRVVLRARAVVTQPFLPANGSLATSVPVRFVQENHWLVFYIGR